MRGKGYITDDLTNHAIEFMTRHKGRQFFCYLPYNTPHSPMEVPDRFFHKFAKFDPPMRASDARQEDIPMTRAALAMCENIDWNVGRVLARLDELKLRDNTIVLYFSDNGPNSWRWNGGMKGRKGSVDEGGVRAPLLIRWPRHIRPGFRISQIAGAIDLLPTLADMCGIPVRTAEPLDGKSVKPILLGETNEWPDRMIFSLQNKSISVRTQQYRLDPGGRLFDITADPGQDRDIAGHKPEIARRLRQAVADWGREVLPLVEKDDRPFLVEYSKITLLPARDGVPQGGIERSNKFPNCSFFTHWTSTDDRMTWDIEVAKAGDYDADIYCTCAPGDLGSIIELSFLDRRVRRKITVANDPPPTGAEADRVPRAESYVKDFRPIRIGTLTLTKSRGLLVLRAIEIAGRQAAEVRYIALTRRG